MGINLQDTYGRKMYKAMMTLTGDEWYDYRNDIVNKINEICPYYVSYASTSMSRIIEDGNKSQEALWCEENLSGRFYGMIGKATKPYKREWGVCFEYEVDAAAFKLRWS